MARSTHESVAGIVPPVRLSVMPPGVAEAVPPQVVLTFAGFAILTPLGKVSVIVAFVSGTPLALVRVTVSWLAEPSTMLLGLKVLLTLGAARAVLTA